MSKKKSPPTVVLQSIFVRDYQRRLRLVIELLEKEACRQARPQTNLQAQAETPRAFTAAPVCEFQIFPSRLSSRDFSPPFLQTIASV